MRKYFEDRIDNISQMTKGRCLVYAGYFFPPLSLGTKITL